MRLKWLLSRLIHASKKQPARRPRNVKLRLECLEDRRLLAVTHSFNAGVLTITGDSADDVINVQQSSMNVFYQANGSGNLGITPVGTVTAVVVKAGAGNDIVTAPTVSKPLTISGGAGNDILSGGPGADVIYGDSATNTVAFVGGEAQASINTKFIVTATGGGVAYRQTSQGGVSTRGYGVNNPNDQGVQGTRGIDGDGANSNPIETLIVQFADGSLSAISASLTLGVNRNVANGNDYVVEAFYGNTSVGSVTGGFGANGANYLQTVNLNFGGQLFDKVTVRNAQLTTDAFVLSAASFETVNKVVGGNDTFLISNARDAFGDIINGGFGTDTVKNVTTAETVVLTDFRTTGVLGTQTVFGVEQFDGNGKSEIRGRDAAFDSGQETDLLDFTGITFIDVTTINLRSGNDKLINGNTALTINGGSGNDEIWGGIGGGTLNGEAGADTLTGGTAATNLNGGAGADILNVGVGATTFTFLINDINGTLASPALNEDTVNGFRQGTDKIRIDTSIYGQGQLTVINGTGPTASGVASKIVTDTTTNPGNTLIYLPGTGNNAFRRIKLLGTITLSVDDFIQV